MQFVQAALAARTNVAGNYRQNTIKHCFSVGIATQVMVIDGKLLKDVNIARIEFEAPLKISGRIFPATLPPVDVATQLKNKRIIWQELTRKHKLGARMIVIEVGTIEMIGIGQMRLSRVRSQTAGGLDRMLRQRQSGRGMVYSENVGFIVGKSQFVVGEEETGITRDSLLQEINYQGQAFFLPRTKHGHGAEILGLHVQLVGNLVGGRPFFDGRFLLR